jgi:hypothetical protein
MQKWLRKALVVTFTILTFGMIAPPPALTMENAKAEEPPKRDYIDQLTTPAPIVSIDELEPENDIKSDFLKQAVMQAEKQSLTKFGNKITPVIESEFYSEILPQIEAVITNVSEQFPEDMLHNLGITEQPSGGVSEKIFHIYDKTTGEDVIRFHVRRDHPPQEGYWFNFHYHVYKDNFQGHHTIGKIYWNKNTPPKWLS